MPNWARSEMYIYGDKKELEKFLADITTLEGDDKWLINFFARKYDLEHNKNLSNQLDKIDLHPTGWIEDVKPNFESSIPNILVIYNSAWDSLFEDFDKLLHEKHHNLNQVTRCEELGNNVFYHTDQMNLFFSEENIIIDLYLEEINLNKKISIFQIFTSAKQALQRCIMELNKNFKTLSEIKKFISKNGNENSFCNIRKCVYVYR